MYSCFRDFRLSGMETKLGKLIFHILADLVYFGGKQSLFSMNLQLFIDIIFL